MANKIDISPPQGLQREVAFDTQLPDGDEHAAFLLEMLRQTQPRRDKTGVEHPSIDVIASFARADGDEEKLQATLNALACTGDATDYKLHIDTCTCCQQEIKGMRGAIQKVGARLDELCLRPEGLNGSGISGQPVPKS